MAAIWTNPDYLASQPFPGIGVTSSFREAAPGYAKGKFQKLPQIKVGPTDFLKVPFPMIGTDFATGQRGVDLQPQVDSAIPKMDTEVQKYLDFYKAISPTRMAEMEQAAQLSSRLTREQLASLYPYLSAAGAESTARNLAASKSFLTTQEQMPSRVQAGMASKQGQMQAASSAAAQELRAAADATRAAKEFAGKFAGQYIQVA